MTLVAIDAGNDGARWKAWVAVERKTYCNGLHHHQVINLEGAKAFGGLRGARIFIWTADLFIEINSLLYERTAVS